MALYILAGALFALPLIGAIALDPLILFIDSKEPVALLVCLFFFFYASKSRKIATNKSNKYIGSFLIFCIFSIYYAPPMQLIYGYENIAGLWQWKALGIMLIYYLFYLGILTLEINEEGIKLLNKAICVSSIISSVYVMIQSLGMDQFQVSKTVIQIGSPEASEITAMIGNATHLGIYLSASLPFMFYHKNKIWVFLILIAIILTKSATALLAMPLFSFLACLFSVKLKRSLKVSLVIGLVLSSLILGYVLRENALFTDNGRFTVWKEIIQDLKTPPLQLPILSNMSVAQMNETERLNKKNYLLTGRGLGSFPIFFSAQKETLFSATVFGSAHNEYLEIFYCLGLGGFLLMMFILWKVLLGSYKKIHLSNFTYCCFLSFIYLIIASFNISTLHVEPIRFLIAFLFCFLCRWI